VTCWQEGMPAANLNNCMHIFPMYLFIYNVLLLSSCCHIVHFVTHDTTNLFFCCSCSLSLSLPVQQAVYTPMELDSVHYQSMIGLGKESMIQGNPQKVQEMVIFRPQNNQDQDAFT